MNVCEALLYPIDITVTREYASYAINQDNQEDPIIHFLKIHIH